MVTARPEISLKQVNSLLAFPSITGIAQDLPSPDSITNPVVNPAPNNDKIEVGIIEMAGIFCVSNKNSIINFFYASGTNIWSVIKN